jgi:hypothetical protein
MTTSIPQLTKLAAWQALGTHYPEVRELPLRNLFADDPKRGERMTVTLRVPKGQSIVVDGEDVVPQVHAVLGKMADFSTTLIRRHGRSRELLHGR